MSKVSYKMAVVALGILLCLPIMALAQTAEIPQHLEPYSWNSGVYDGEAGRITLAESQTVVIADAAWLRLQFSDAYLGSDSYIVIRSRKDGAEQRLNTRTLWEWQNTSAYFNGDAVRIQLYVGGNDVGVFVNIEEVIVGEVPSGITPDTQCGPTDDRVPSNNPATGRILNVGCTGWIIDNGLHVTAGHCSGGSLNTLQFNVPDSNPNGSINHPGPEDQYSVAPASKQFVSGGIGNDWGVFEVFDNSMTGLQPIEAQGASFTVKQDLDDPTIRITGYGVDSSPPGSTGARNAQNQTQQTHAGPNAGSSGTTMRYVTDTEGGSSGSPVIDNATGEAVGVHTHGGCSIGGGNNSGTSTFNTAFWAALNPTVHITVVAAPGSPVIIPGSGLVFDFDVTIDNNSNSTLNAQTWNKVALVNAGNEEVGPVAGIPVTNITVAPNSSITITFTLEIPSGVPAGTYPFNQIVGTFPSFELDRDSFTFIKAVGPTLAKAGTYDWGLSPGKAVTVPGKFALEQNYPNPFNPSTTIAYQLPSAEIVRITIYDLTGRRVLELLNETREAGSYTAKWSGRNQSGGQVASGLYIYQIQAGQFTQSRKMLFMK